MKEVHDKTDFSGAWSSDQSSRVLTEVIANLVKLSNHPVPHIAGALAICLVRNPSLEMFDNLCALNPDGSMSATDYYVLRQIQALFSKREEIYGLSVDKESAAFDKFLESEEICFKMNRALRNTDDPHYADRAVLLHRIQRKISVILGDCPRLEELNLGFGPGSNVGCGKNTSVRMKLSARATATEAAGRAFSAIADQFHAWPGLTSPQAVRGSNWTSVPKTFRTNRGINVEPIINTFCQKGIGLWIRERLLREGVDLTDQTANQLLAQLGSTMSDSPWGLATLDLSMASDTIAYNLVMDLLPYDWFVLLDTFRCAECKVPNGSWRVLEKFSSMGNGYTFELETLIFYACLSVVCEEGSLISAYGDDLICPVSQYDKVVAALTLLGFRVNTDKSFHEGPFRESCGRDFWHGTNVRPCFLKKDISLQQVYRLYNYFKRTGWLDASFLLEFIPSGARHFGPDGYGDGHLIGECAVKRDKRGWEPFYEFKSFASKPRVVKKDMPGDLGAVLFNLEKSGSRSSYQELLNWKEPEGFQPPEKDSVYSQTMKQERSFKTKFQLKNVRVTAVT